MLMSILALVAVGCASTYEAKVEFDVNTEVDMSQYKTFSWLKESKIMVASSDLNPVMKLRIDKEIEHALEQKGYTYVADAEKADFVVTYTVGSRDKIRVDTFPSSFHSDWAWGGGYYGRHHGMHMGTETRVRNYTEGKLAIDIFDVKTHQPAWHGSATKRITKADEKNYEQTINLIVSQVLAQY